MKSTDNTFGFEKAEDSTGFLLWQVTNLWQREIKKALETCDLTHVQYVLLASTHWLSLHGQEVTQVLLSAHTKVDPMTISTVLRALQTRGFLLRKEHPTDTRAKTVHLTEQGKEIVKAAVIAVEQFDAAFFSGLGDGTSDFNKKLALLLSNESV